MSSLEETSEDASDDDIIAWALIALAQTLGQRDALRNARRRYAFIREAYGDGRGMDPDIIAGLKWAALALSILDAVATTPERGLAPRDRRLRHARLNRGRG